MKQFLLYSLLLLSLSAKTQGKFFGGNGDGFATATIANGALPLQVLNFSGSVNNNIVQARLLFSGSEQLCAIQPEKSVDGARFYPLQAPQAIIPRSGIAEYLFSDNRYSPPVSYYRAAMIRCDGSMVYTSILPFRVNGQVQFYTAGTNLYYQHTIVNATIEIFNTAGLKIYQTVLPGNSGMVSLNGLKQGLYFIRTANAVPVKIFIP